MKLVRICSVLLLVLVFNEARPCTAFCQYYANRAVLARNLDWPVDEGLILINQAGIREGRSLYGDTIQWLALYRSISFTQFGPGLPLGGMNEKGLVVEELNGPQFEVKRDLPGFCLNELQLIQYLLDCCTSVKEAKMALDTLLVGPDLLPLHYLLMDRMGNSLVIEPVTGHFELVDPCSFGIPVLSNNAYKESLRYLSMFQGFGGELPVQHRPGSNERFVSVADLLRKEGSDKDSWKNPVHRAFSILDTVSQEDTRWSLVYEPRELCVYLKFHSCTYIQKFSLLHILDHREELFLAMEMACCSREGAGAFHCLQPDCVVALLQRVGNKLCQILDQPGLQNLFLNWENYSLSFINQ